MRFLKHKKGMEMTKWIYGFIGLFVLKNENLKVYSGQLIVAINLLPTIVSQTDKKSGENQRFARKLYWSNQRDKLNLGLSSHSIGSTIRRYRSRNFQNTSKDFGYASCGSLCDGTWEKVNEAMT